MNIRRWNLVAVTAGLTVGLSSAAFAGGGGKQGSAFIERELKQMDTNGDQKLNAEEHAAGARKMFETMDTNKDGKVTAPEMEAGHEQVTGQKAKKGQMSAVAKIKECDTDNDGALTADEQAAGAKKMFEKMDTDKNGELTKNELASGHARMLHDGNKEHGSHKDTK
jgi:hypothetical protein